MHVEAQVVRRAVHHPAPVVLAVLLVEGVVDRDSLGQQPPRLEVLGDHSDGGGVHVAEQGPRSHCGDAGLLGGEDGVVDLALGGR